MTTPADNFVQHLHALATEIDETTKRDLALVAELRKARLAQATLLTKSKPIGYAGGKP